MLETMSDEDITSHLYVTEAYYFNPKQIKRQQVSQRDAYCLSISGGFRLEPNFNYI
jgi:hypothetical protein